MRVVITKELLNVFLSSVSVGKSAVTGVDGDGLNWLVFELLWRDFFRLGSDVLPLSCVFVHAIMETSCFLNVVHRPVRHP